jgi:hypothetical protein
MLSSSLVNAGANSNTRKATTPIPVNSTGLLQSAACQRLTVKQRPYTP